MASRLHQGMKEVKWSVPDGFKIAPEPAILDGSLVDSAVYMRWETYGWQVGKITSSVTNATPRLVKKFNYRIVWADGTKGPAKLQVDNYALWPWAPRSLQLLGHLDSSHWWHWGLSRVRVRCLPPTAYTSAAYPPPTLRRRLSGDACPWL